MPHLLSGLPPSQLWLTNHSILNFPPTVWLPAPPYYSKHLTISVIVKPTLLPCKYIPTTILAPSQPEFQPKAMSLPISLAPRLAHHTPLTSGFTDHYWPLLLGSHHQHTQLGYYPTNHRVNSHLLGQFPNPPHLLGPTTLHHLLGPFPNSQHLRGQTALHPLLDNPYRRRPQRPHRPHRLLQARTSPNTTASPPNRTLGPRCNAITTPSQLIIPLTMVGITSEVIDIGATDVFFDSNTVQPHKQLTPCATQHVTGAGGHLMRILGTITGPMLIGTVLHPAVTGYVVDNLLGGQVPIVLGMMCCGLRESP